MSRSKICTIIGSTRYETGMRRLSVHLNLAGYACFYPTNIVDYVVLGSEERLQKGEMQCIKNFRNMIDVSDFVVLYNENDYIGEHTKMNLKYAIANNKDIFALHRVDDPSVLHQSKVIIGGNTAFPLGFLWHLYYEQKKMLMLHLSYKPESHSSDTDIPNTDVFESVVNKIRIYEEKQFGQVVHDHIYGLWNDLDSVLTMADDELITHIIIYNNIGDDILTIKGADQMCDTIYKFLNMVNVTVLTVRDPRNIVTIIYDTKLSVSAIEYADQPFYKIEKI